jgi:tRNA U55 pseudouridine synthase TruB
MKILYKDTAVTLYNFIKQCKQEGYLQGKYCYCGRLDPMASGKMLFLEDKECSDMSAFLKCDKEYEFEICLGISTDTDDILGIIEEINFETLNTFDTMGMLDKQLNTILLQTTQQYHKFSAFQIKHNNIRVNLCELSKQHKLNKQDIPSKPCKVHSIKKLNKKTVNLIYYINIILQTLESLHDPNDYYRKQEIIKRWKKFKDTIHQHLELELIIYKYKITVSSGFYIRQLIADLKNNCNFPLMVLNIKRTQIYKDGCPL